MNLIRYFPGEPRGEQEKTLKRIEEAFIDKKYVICQAPTGSGKSHMAATMALSTSRPPNYLINSSITPKSHYSEDKDSITKYGAFILTTTKQLQDQYETLFNEDITILKGKNNYPCGANPICNAGCAQCAYIPSVMARCVGKGICEYVNAYSAAMKNNFSVLNYSMFFSLPDCFKNKEILICDEASEMEDAIISHHSMDVRYKHLDFLGVNHSPLKKADSESGFLWISKLHGALLDAMPSAKFLMRKNASKYITDKARNIKELLEKVKLLQNYWNDAEFILELSNDGVVISPLKINKLAQNVFAAVDKVVFLSATIIDHVKMAQTFGIGSDEYSFIDVKSDFDPKKSPIYIGTAKFDMRYNYIDASLGKLVESVLELSELHKDDNGIIHTHNFKITKAIQDAVNGNPRFLFRDEFSSNEDILFEHFNNPNPTVIVSPSLAFGTSLDNEHGRFQIITKLPYLPMNNKRVKILSERDFDWYEMKMWTKLIQMCGRCTRSKDDYSITYIFDKSFINAIRRYESKLPKWFENRLK